MKTGRKRKFSSPEPQLLHTRVKGDSVCGSHEGCRLPLGPGTKISTPTKRKAQNTLSPRRYSPRFKYHGHKPGCLEMGNDIVQPTSGPESSPLLSEEDTELGLVITVDEDRSEEDHLRRKTGGKPKKGTLTNDQQGMSDEERTTDVADQEEDSEEELMKLDRDLDIKSKQHNLTAGNVRSIIHEVITNEHVVAMMKAAIKETQDMPMFEPKMTRSKLKEVVEKGVGIPSWNISPIKKSNEAKPPQFVDILLEEEEDSSDEEYQPDEDEEDETGEETIIESDMDSIASSPRVSRRARSRTPIEILECDEQSCSPRQTTKPLRHLRVEAVPMGPPAPPPSQSCGSSRPLRTIDSFMEKLHAVDEELELSPICMEPYQTLSSSGDAEASLMACRTRSKRPLRDVPLDQLEAELHPPDITPDMYDCVSALEDKEWSQWLQGLMTSRLENEEEGDDDDDPEYNFLDDLDEPDLEDYRNDRAVRITKKEVNELMEELFETLQDELRVEQDEENQEEDEEQNASSSQSTAKFNVPQAMRFEEPLAHVLTACRRTVRGQLDGLQQRREQQSRPNQGAPAHAMVLVPPPSSLGVTPVQKQQLQQHIQQHVQLLTQINLLCAPVQVLQSQASTTKLFLTELQSFAERAEQIRSMVDPGFRSVFRVCNLQPSLDLLKELQQTPSPPPPSCRPRQSRAVNSYPLLPAHLAWLFATRSAFVYPELLPHRSLDPALQVQSGKNFYSKVDDGLIVLGLKHFNETEFPYHLMSQYLIQTKRLGQLRARVKDLCSNRAPDNAIKHYCQHGVVPPLPVACCSVMPGDERPPVERETNIMPNWLQKSVPYIHKAVFGSQTEENMSSNTTPPSLIFPKGTQYPRSLPKGLTLLLHPSARPQKPAGPPKPRPLYGFTRPSLTPLAKAPPCNTGTVNLLPNVPAPTLPSQGVILVTQTPCVPLTGAVSATPVTRTPAYAAAPLNSVDPVNFQYVVPQVGCVNPVRPPACLPPAVVQVPSTSSVMCNTPLPPKGLVTASAIHTMPKKSELPKKQVLPRRITPIQPCPLNQVPQMAQLITLVPGSVSLSNNTTPSMDQATAANFSESLQTLPSTIVIQPSSFPDAAVVYPQVAMQELVKSSVTPSPQDAITQPISTFSHLEVYHGQHLPSRVNLMPGQELAENEIKLKSSPVFFSHTPSAPHHATKSSKSSRSVPTITQLKPSCEGTTMCEEKCEPAHSSPMTDHARVAFQNTQGNGVNIMNLNTSLSAESRSLLPATDSQNLTMDSSQYVLVQTCSQGGTPQFLLFPKHSLIQSHPDPNPADGESKLTEPNALPTSTTFHAFNVQNVNVPGNMKPLPNGLDVVIQDAAPTTEGKSGETCKDEMETEVKEEDEEEMTATLFGSPFLTLSESMCSTDSSLSSMESSTGTWTGSPSEETEADCSTPADEREVGESERQEKEFYSFPATEDQEKSKERIPGQICLTSGAEKQQASGEGEGQSQNSREERYEGENQQNGEGGGGDGQDGKGEEEKREDGEGGGGRDGGRQGNSGGDKNDEEKDGDGEHEEEEEDFDELTQDEDEEEVLSSASEESVLSVPELQETMEKLTWLASERRLCGEGDSEEDNSPNSPTSPTSPTSPVSQNSQEENSEDEEDGAMKGEELEPAEGEGEKLPEGDTPQEDDPPQSSGKCAGRGRGRGRPTPRSLRRSRRQERGSKDTSKLLLLYDDHILDNDPMRDSKDIAFAQAYLNRVREAMQDTPGKMEEFLGVLYEFEQAGESRSAVELYFQLKPLLKEWPELLRDFAAFLLPEQALECGLFEEQQAFDRSRRFLRQLEISFGENPSHYQKIVRVLQAGSVLSPASKEEVKTQMATLLKGHTHLQGEFSVFFDELRPPPAHPGQFEEAVWPEDGVNVPEGGDGNMSLASGGFEVVALPDLEEEEEMQKIPQITGRSRRRKELRTHRNYKVCEWPEKDCSCHCHDSHHEAKHRRHKRKACPRCHGNKATDSSKTVKSPDPSFTTADPVNEKGGEREECERAEEERGEEKETDTAVKDETGSGANSPPHEPEVQTWEGSEGDAPLNSEEREDEVEDEVDEWKEEEGEHCSPPSKQSKNEDGPAAEHAESSSISQSTEKETVQQRRQSPSSDTPVCAKNISLTPSGEKVVLWTREADRVILTSCQQQGANHSTFQAISAQLGNKTASEVSKRFRDLMRLFHTSARQASSEDEGAEQHSATDDEQD